MKYLKGLLVWLVLCAPASAQLGDISGSIIFLGHPGSGKWEDGTKWVFARNIWAMKWIPAATLGTPGFGDVATTHYLFLGQGSMGPDNAGPVYPLLFFAVQNGIVFDTSSCAAENCGFFGWSPPLCTEEISNFVLIPGAVPSATATLFLPAIDPRENTDCDGSARTNTLGQFYVLDGGFFWQERRTVPGMWHMWDMVGIGNPVTKYLVVGNGVLDQYGAVRSAMQSTTDSITWTDMTCDSVSCISTVGRAYRMITIGGEIYAVTRLGTASPKVRIYKYAAGTNNWLVQNDATVRQVMLPNDAYRLWAPAIWAGGVVYLTGHDDALGNAHGRCAIHRNRRDQAGKINHAAALNADAAGLSPANR